jgi:hypothetical protein
MSERETEAKLRYRIVFIYFVHYTEVITVTNKCTQNIEVHSRHIKFLHISAQGSHLPGIRSTKFYKYQHNILCNALIKCTKIKITKRRSRLLQN